VPFKIMTKEEDKEINKEWKEAEKEKKEIKSIGRSSRFS